MNLKRLQKLRHQAFVRQNCRCFYCTLPIWEEDSVQFTTLHEIKPRKAKHLRCTAEHLIAQQDGGGETALNIAAACLWCNRMRHCGHHHKAPSPEKHKQRVTQLIAKGHWHPVAALYRGKSN